MRKRNGWITKMLIVCLSFVSLFKVIPYNVWAEEPVSITIYHNIEEEHVPDVTFSLYRVGTVSDQGKIILADAFSGYAITMDCQDTNEWKHISETLAGYCVRDDITPEMVAKTDTNGVIVFGDNGNLTEGIYLILGEDHMWNGQLCDLQPIMISVSNTDEDGNQQKKVGIHTKYTISEQLDHMTVVKVWENDQASVRPEEVVVQLYDNTHKTIYAEAILNEANQWRYTWTNLPADRTWSVLEKEIPEGYSVMIQREQAQVEMKNTKVETDDPDSSEDRLIQTGRLWWPVPVLTVCGILFVLIGLLRGQRNE